MIIGHTHTNKQTKLTIDFHVHLHFHSKASECRLTIVNFFYHLLVIQKKELSENDITKNTCMN